jgi:hypothetical protein
MKSKVDVVKRQRVQLSWLKGFAVPKNGNNEPIPSFLPSASVRDLPARSGRFVLTETGDAKPPGLNRGLRGQVHW